VVVGHSYAVAMTSDLQDLPRIIYRWRVGKRQATSSQELVSVNISTSAEQNDKSSSGYENELGSGVVVCAGHPLGSYKNPLASPYIIHLHYPNLD